MRITVARPENQLSGAQSLEGQRVLVVEDEFFIADDLAQALRQQGAEVIGPIARLGAAMAALSAPGTIDFAVLDVNLDGDPAFPIGDALRARDVPFVFATGYEREFIPPRFRDVPYWEKPFDAGGLARAVCGLSRRGGPAHPPSRGLPGEAFPNGPAF